MKAAVLDAPHHLRLEERPLPALQPGWALIQVRAAGICGSDVHFYTGEFPLAPGSVRGHEVAGVVSDPGNTGLSPGQAVVIHPLIGCGLCAACRRGETQLCVDLQAIGGTYPGGFAECVAAPVGNLYPFDAGRLSFRHAVFADGVAVAVHAMNKVGFKPGETAVILGDGTIGLLLLQVALARGARSVILAGKHERNLEIARTCGASLAFAAHEIDPVVVVLAAAGPVDVVFEAAGGDVPLFSAGLRMLRKGGRLAILGFTASSQVAIPWIDLVIGELALTGVMGYGIFDGQDEMQQAIDLLQSGALALEPLITHSVPLDQVQSGFESILDRRTSRAIKVLVLPPGASG